MSLIAFAATLVSSLWVSLVLLGATTAVAATGAYSDDARFFLTADSLVDLTTFEAGGNRVLESGASVGPLTLGFVDPSLRLVIDDPFAAVSPVRALGVESEDSAFVGGDELTLVFDRTVQGFGLYVITEEAPGARFFTVTASSGAFAQNGVVSARALSDGSAYFVGVVDESGFDSAVLASSSAADFPFTIDDVVLVDIATVPEPDPAVLAIAAIAVLGTQRSRRKIRRTARRADGSARNSDGSASN